MFHHQRELVSQVGSSSEWILIINVINDIKDCLFPSHILHACVKQHISSWKQCSLSDSTQRVTISFMFDCACPVWTMTTQQLKETDSNLGYKRKRTVVFHHIRIKPNSKGAYVKPPGIDVHSAVDSLPCYGAETMAGFLSDIPATQCLLLFCRVIWFTAYFLGFL